MPQANDFTPPPYLAFKTFQSAIQGLRTHGLPSELDRTAWNTKSGTDQSQIVGALKFFGLIDRSGATQPSLRDLVATAENSQEEKKVLESILRPCYEKVFALDLKNATPKQLDDAIGDYGVTGQVKTRAVRFFLKAAQYVGIQLSSRLTMKLRDRDLLDPSDGTSTVENGKQNGGETVVRRKRRQRIVPPPAQAQTVPGGSGSQASSAMKTIDLPKVGGSLSITGTFNAFMLMGDERDLVYKIIDLMNEYEQKSATGAA